MRIDLLPDLDNANVGIYVSVIRADMSLGVSALFSLLFDEFWRRRGAERKVNGEGERSGRVMLKVSGAEG